MLGLPKLVFVESKLFLRDPLSVFFTLALPVILMFTNGGGDQGQGRLRDVDLAAPMLITMTVGILAFTCLPVYLAEYREKGVLRRLSATPLRPSMVLVAHLMVHFVVALAALALVFGVGLVAFDLTPPAQPVAFASAFLLGVAAMFALGLLLAALVRTGRAATVVGIGLFLPMLYVSGTAMPRENLPEWLGRIGDHTPLSPVVGTLRDTWAGAAPQTASLAILIVITVVAGGLAARFFRWE